MIKNVIQAIINLFGFKNEPKLIDSELPVCCKQTKTSRKQPKKTTRKKNQPKNNK